MTRKTALWIVAAIVVIAGGLFVYKINATPNINVSVEPTYYLSSQTTSDPDYVVYEIYGTATNDGNKTAYINYNDFKLVTADGTKYSISIEYVDTSSEIKPGETLEGYIYFDAPKDTEFAKFEYKDQSFDITNGGTNTQEQ